VIQGIKQVVEETEEKLVEEAGKIAKGVITGEELVKDIKPMDQEEYQNKVEEDEKKKQEGIKEIGRNVEKEMDEVRKAKKKKEEEEEKEFLEKIRRQRELEEQERQALEMEAMSVSRNPAKQKKQRGSAFKPGKPKQSDMSQTAEFSKSVD